MLIFIKYLCSCYLNLMILQILFQIKHNTYNIYILFFLHKIHCFKIIKYNYRYFLTKILFKNTLKTVQSFN
jgi:hypothetical protein